MLTKRKIIDLRGSSWNYSFGCFRKQKVTNEP